MVGDRGDSIEVVLEDGAGGGPAAGPAGRLDDPVRARRRRRRLIAAGLVAAVALGVTSTVLTAQDERRERARQEALADVARVLPPLDGRLVELWRVAEGSALAVGRDVVLLETASPDLRTLEVRAFDLRTGVHRWTHRVGADDLCVPLSEDAGPTRWRPGDTIAEYLVCHRAFASVEGYRMEIGGPDEVTVLDVATGQEVGTVPTPADVVDLALVGRDVLVASLVPEGGVAVSRWAFDTPAPTSARQVWSARLPQPLEDGDASGWVFEREATVLRAGTSGSIPLDLATGEPRPDAARAGVLYAEDAPLPGGGRVEWDRDEVGQTTAVSRVYRADGGRSVELDGVPWLPLVADGSAPQVLLLRRPTALTDTGELTGDLVAVDVTTGQDLWNAGRMPGLEPLARLDGLVVAAGAGKVLALDVRSGEVVWEESRSGASPMLGALTDGELILVAEASGAGSVAVARDVRTGAERWRVDLAPFLPDGPYWLVPTRAGLLLLSWDQGARMVGPRG